MRFPKKGRREWSSLPAGERRGIGLAALVQFALLAVAFQDWVRRPSAEMRGPKAGWLPVLFVNFVGPIAYLAWGRYGGEEAL